VTSRRHLGDATGLNQGGLSQAVRPRQLCDLGHDELQGLIGRISVSRDRKLVYHELLGGRLGLFTGAGANPAGCVEAEAVNASRFDVNEEKGTSLDHHAKNRHHLRSMPTRCRWRAIPEESP
jgi:hypothetical protein